MPLAALLPAASIASFSPPALSRPVAGLRSSCDLHSLPPSYDLQTANNPPAPIPPGAPIVQGLLTVSFLLLYVAFFAIGEQAAAALGLHWPAPG